MDNLKITNNSNNSHNSINSEIAVVIIGALVFIVSFMWKDFFTDIEQVIFSGNPTLTEKFFYILFISIIGFGIIVFVKNNMGVADKSIVNMLDNSPINTGDNTDG